MSCNLMLLNCNVYPPKYVRMYCPHPEIIAPNNSTCQYIRINGLHLLSTHNLHSQQMLVRGECVRFFVSGYCEVGWTHAVVSRCKASTSSMASAEREYWRGHSEHGEMNRCTAHQICSPYILDILYAYCSSLRLFVLQTSMARIASRASRCQRIAIMTYRRPYRAWQE